MAGHECGQVEVAFGFFGEDLFDDATSTPALLPLHIVVGGHLAHIGYGL